MSDMDGLYEQVMYDILSSCGKEMMNNIGNLGPTLIGNREFGIMFYRAHKGAPAHDRMKTLAEWMLWMVGQSSREDRIETASSDSGKTVPVNKCYPR